MNEVESNVVSAVEQAGQNTPIVQVAEAAMNTAANPSVGNILADIELVISLAKQLKTLAWKHPTLESLVKVLF